MKMKWKMLLLSLLAIGLLAGGSTAVFARSAAQPDLEPLTASLEEAIGDLQISDGSEILPELTPGEKLSIDGGFRGVWGVWEEDETDQSMEYPGKVAGLYGSITRADGTSYGFVGGVYTQRSGKLGGFLFGRYADGFFWGRWHSATGEANGQLKGTYDVNTDAVDAILKGFRGEWQTSDGSRTGYIKGTYSPKVSIQITGRFGGKWADNDSTAATADMADGTLKGHYGVIRLADGTVIRCFRGGWYSDEGSATGRLEGIGLGGHFYGIWHNTDGKPAGYLAGKYGENRFRGVWGNMGEEPRGSLWGRYGPLPVVDAESLPVPDKVKMQTLPEEVQLEIMN